MFLFTQILSQKLCSDNPDSFVVFGDNLINKGRAGQAIIRYEPNSIGVPTKKLPSMNANAFFSDSNLEYKKVSVVLEKLKKLDVAGKTIILPSEMFGSGLAQVSIRAPKIWKLIQDFYEHAKKQTKEKKMKKLNEVSHFKSEYDARLENDIICIKDKETLTSVVNNAEMVINEIHQKHPNWQGKEINLLNSDGTIDYLLPDYQTGKVNFKFKSTTKVKGAKAQSLAQRRINEKKSLSRSFLS